MGTLFLTKEAKIYNRAKTASSISRAGRNGQLRRMKLEHFLTPYTKINSKCVKDLNVGLDILNLLEENIGRILCDINHSNMFFSPSPRIMEVKEKIISLTSGARETG